MIAFVNNQFIEEEKATLGIKDLSIHRGYGIFDFFRTSNYVPLFLDNYLDRFFTSALTLKLQPMHSREELKDIIGEMNSKNRIPVSGFKMILTGGYSSDGYELSPSNFIILQQPAHLPGREKFDEGIKIILYEYMRDLPLVKSINYLVGVYLQQEVQRRKADDVLYYKDGNILEFPRSNIFIVTKDRAIITPSENILHGITRMKVLELARKKYITEERAITADELRNAAEVFLTSTTKRILPVLSIDDKTIGNGRPGEVTSALYDAFIEMEKTLIPAAIY